MKDNNGTKIEEGKRVVFNRSGELEFGILEKIVTTKKTRWGSTYTDHTFHVKADRFPKKVSKVQRAQNLMVIV